jgi:hypothetical protein
VSFPFFEEKRILAWVGLCDFSGYSLLGRLCVRHSDRGSKAQGCNPLKCKRASASTATVLGCRNQAMRFWFVSRNKKSRAYVSKKIPLSLYKRETCVFKGALFVSRSTSSPKPPNILCRPTTVGDGFHNVSRWMTWLPISLKNAAKCDKWYQLQNLSITESLNANGARKKAPLVFNSEHAMSSVSNKTQKTKRQILCLVSLALSFSPQKRKKALVAPVRWLFPCLCPPLWVR